MKVVIDKKYIRKERKGKGYTSSVYIVEEIDTKNIYAAKILSKHSQCYDNEKEILEFLKDKNIPNIIKLMNSGEGDIIEGKTVHKKQYLILEYADKGDLSQYSNIPGRPLKENHAKHFFQKF
jgi:serine/threonine protein kinase